MEAAWGEARGPFFAAGGWQEGERERFAIKGESGGRWGVSASGVRVGGRTKALVAGIARDVLDLLTLLRTRGSDGRLLAHAMHRILQSAGVCRGGYLGPGTSAGRADRGPASALQ